MEVTISPITPAQVKDLQALSIRTFSQTFTEDNTQEDLNKYINNSFNIEKLTSELNNQNSQFYFACIEAVQVGYIKLNINDAQSEQFDLQAIELERIYVDSNFLGKKVGGMLLKYALDIARKGAYHYIWLGVWEENHRALRFYEKNGFVAFDKHIFKMGDDEQTDLLMKLVL
jgi:ribosomal protein S18 acetylase RimI-like enzyme